MVTLEERISKAVALRAEGYNCSQCVAMTFNPALEAVTAGLGTGVGNTGNICGAASAMAIVCGDKTYTGPADKKGQYARVSALINKFAALNQGQVNCRDLRCPGRKPCVDLIKDAITILHEANL